MAVDIKVPSVGESVQEAVLAQWYKSDGDRVKKDEPLFAVETDKVTLEVVAEADGILHIKVQEGETVAVGSVVGTIETEGEKKEEKKPEKEPERVKEKPPEEKQAPEKEIPEPEEAEKKPSSEEKREEPVLPPSVRTLVKEKGLDVSQIQGSGPGGRITKGDVLLHLERQEATLREKPEKEPEKEPAPERKEKEEEKPSGKKAEAEEHPSRRKTMSPIRQRIAARLLEARQNTAMLTTFNEIDMSRVQALRDLFKTSFKEKYGVSLGIMSFFIKASIEALREIPEINAFIDGKDIVYHEYYHIGIAVGAKRGLVVPVIRHADRLGFAEIEKAIEDFVVKVNENRLELKDLEGGTFTITNGGVFGSLLSTPILNTPQSGILGMHKIEKRPVAIDDQVVIRPMMYVALTYDHRIVDGRGAVTFLKRIKECVENPERMMLNI